MQRLNWLTIPLTCGITFAIALICMLWVQATRVAAEAPAMQSGVVRYVSTRGTNVGNNCQSSTSPCESIQRVLQVAQAGDYIHVAGGIYTETTYDNDLAMGITATVIITKDIRSFLGGYSADFSTRDIQAYETILSAAGSLGAQVAILANTNVRFGGFTLTGGGGAYSPGRFYYPGGAIRVFGGSPMISDNTIINNRAYRRGGGIYVGRGATPSILNNRIISNTIITLEGDSNSEGGGIYIASGPTLIRDNVILSNTAQGEGAGIYVGWNVVAAIISNTIGYNQLLDPFEGRGAGISTTGDDVEVVIRGNHIYANALTGDFEGSGLYVSSPAIIDGNWIEDNQAPGDQSALCIAEVTAPVTITNNIISENTGTGVQAINNRDVRMVNNTIARNTFRGVQVRFPDVDTTGTGTFTLRNSIVANNAECGVFIENPGNQLLDYNDVVGQRYQYCGFPSIQAHNLSRNPIFVDPSSSNYHLGAGSPAINRGDGSLAPLTDFDGILRSQNYNVDIGAYEFVYLRTFLPITLKVLKNMINPTGLH